MSLNKTVSLLISFSILFLFEGAYSQDDMTHVDSKCFVKPQRAPSIFHHDVHNEKAEIGDCSMCHHVYDEKNQGRVEGESSEGQSCSDCHLQGIKKTKVSLTRAFHLACKNCHQERKSGPVGCAHCHLNERR